MLGSADLLQLAGLTLEKQVIELLLELDAWLPRAQLQSQLVPKPTDAALATLLERMRKARQITYRPTENDEEPPLIGLPGWTLEQAVAAAPAVKVPAVAIHTHKENSMPKKRAPRIKPEIADQTVGKLLQDAAEGLTTHQIIAETQYKRPCVHKSLARLKKAGLAQLAGRGHTAIWTHASKGNGAAPAIAPGSTTPPRVPRANGHDSARKFGYFSDGSVSIECATCTGTMTGPDLKAFRQFAERIEEASK